MERTGWGGGWRAVTARVIAVVMVAVAAVSSTAVPDRAHASPCGDTDGPCESPMRASGGTPIVSGIYPAAGSTAGGTVVSVSGSGFTGATLVTFGGVPGTSVTIANDGQLTVTSPAHYPGDVVVQVANDGVSSSPSGFVFHYAPAGLTWVSDDVVPAAGGVVRTFTGFGFLAATGVLFDSAPGTALNIINDTTLEVTVPAHVPGFVRPKVTTPSGAGLQWIPMLYVGGGPPAVDSVLPPGGPASGGTTVTITGSGFSDARSVTFDGIQASFSIDSDNTIQATAPGHAAGAVPVMVSGITGTSVTGWQTVYTYDLPRVTGLAPASGPTAGGTSVLIAGINFTGASTVSFDGIPATGVVVNSDMSITATTPAHVAGLAAVTVTTAYGTSPVPDTGYNRFDFSDTVRVESVSPSWGGPAIGGTAVTLTGKGFAGATSVTFGGNAGLALSIANGVLIGVTTPATPQGLVPVVVTSPSGTSSGVPRFYFSSSPPPAVVGLEPDAGPEWGGNTVTIHGRGLASVTSVTFGGVPATIQAAGDTWVYVVAPAHAAGPVNVVVTSANGSSATGAASSYGYGRPRIFSGPEVIATAGQRVWLYGEGFTGASNVKFDGVSGTSLTVQDDHTLSVNAPAHATGLVGVTVSGSFGTNTIPYVVPTVPIATTGASPSAGPAAGGTTVSIFGVGFTGATSVTFGGVPGTGLVVGDDSQLIVVTPAHAIGTVPVMVTSPAGTAGAAPYTFLPAPTVTNVSPGTGSSAGGTVVTITGTNLSALTDVTFGGVSGTGLSVNSDTQIQVTTPTHAAGVVDVIVTTTGGASATGPAAQFTYTQAAPVVTGLVSSVANDARGPASGGTTVAIYGSDFTGVTSVSFGGVNGTSLSVVNDNYLEVVTPAHADGEVPVVVTSPAGSSESAPGYRPSFTFNEVYITAVTPASGPPGGGTPVTLTGWGFSGISKVTFDQLPGTSLTVQSDTTAVVTSPVHGPGSAQVVAQGTYQTMPTATTFTYTGSVPGVPSFSVQPAGGPSSGGTTVHLQGIGLPAVTSVAFGGVSVPFAHDGYGGITATSPAHAAGVVPVTVTTAVGTSEVTAHSLFAFDAAWATGAYSRSNGPTTGGTTVQLEGGNFTGATSVTFGGVPGSIVSINSNASMTVTSPAHAAGLVPIEVSGPGGNVGGGAYFLYSTAGAISLSPDHGPPSGGTLTTLTGWGLTGASQVLFGCSTGTFGTNINVLSDTSLTVETPTGGMPMCRGAVFVRTASAITALGDASFGFYFSPTVTNVSPATGSSAGGTLVTITGTNLAAVMNVTFGGALGTGVGVNSDTEITVTAPAHAAGVVDVIVTTPGGASATGPAAQFTYTQGGPVVSQIWTRGGPVGGGTSVGIYGTGLSSATGVTFGGVPATSVSIVDDSSITAVSPAHGVGTVDVVVTSATGNSAPSSTSRFSYGTPWVGYVTPGTGPWVGGTAVMVSGGGFTGATAVAFDGVPAASFNVVADNEIQAVTPYHQTGVSVITVTGAGGASDQTGEYLFAGIASVNHGFQHVSIGVPSTIVFTLGAGTTCYNDPDDPGTDTDVDCTAADLSLSPGIVLDFAVTQAPLAVGGTLVTVTFASNTNGSGTLGLRGPLQVPGINTTQFGQWFNWAAIAPELRHVATEPAGEPVTGGGAAGQAGIADNGSAVVTRVRSSRNIACTVAPGTGTPDVLGFVPAVIPLTNVGQVVLTTGGGYDGPQPVGPQTPTFTDVSIFTGDFSNGGLPGATCISWVSTGAGQQSMSITYTGYDSATHSVLWDSDGDGNGLGLPNQPLVTEWSVLEKVRMPTTSSPADPVNGPSPSIALSLVLNPGTGLYELNLPGAHRAFDAVALGSHLNAASARFDSWLAGAGWTVALGPGSCGELTGTTSGVTSLTSQGIAGNPLHAVFTAGSALGNNCTPSSTATIVFTANELLLSSSQISVSDTLTITFTAPVPHKYVLLAWAGQRVVLEHDWRTPPGDTPISGSPMGTCPLAAPDNVVRYVRGSGGGNFVPGLGVTVVSESEATVEVTGNSQAGDIPWSPQDACISRVIYEAEDPGQVDIEVFPDWWQYGGSKAAFTIFYMKYNQVSLSFLTGVSKQYHNSSTYPEYSPGNPWSLLNDSVSDPVSWNVSRDLLVRGRVKGWFVNENPSGRPQDSTDPLNVLPANRWVMPDDWAVLAGGPPDNADGSPATGTAETFRPYYDIMFGPNNAPGMTLGGIFGLNRVTVARVVADPANTASTFRVTSTSNIVPGEAIFIGPPFVLTPVLSIASGPPRVTLTGPLGSVPAANAEIAVPHGGLTTFEGPFSTLDTVVGGGNTPTAGSLASSTVSGGAAPSNVPGASATRDTALGDGDINWWDAPMPPALVSVKIRGSGYLKQVRKQDVYYGGTALRNYPNPYYVTNIPGSPFIPATVPGGGYYWDSWGDDGPVSESGAWASANNGANGTGPYLPWTPLPAFLSAATQGTNAAGVADTTLSSAEVTEIAAIKSASGDTTAARDLVVYSDNHGEFMVTANGDFKLTLAGCDMDPVGGGKWCDRDDVVGTGTVSAVAEYPDFRGKHFTVASNAIAANWTWGGYTEIAVHSGETADFAYLVVHTLDRDGACAPQAAFGAYSLHPALSWMDAGTSMGAYDVVSAASFFLEQHRATIVGQSGGGTLGAGSFSATGVQFFSVQTNEPGTTGIAEFPLSALAAPGQTDECQAWVRVQKGAQVPESALITFATDEGTLGVDRVLFNALPAAPQNVVATPVAGPGMQVTWTDGSPGSTVAFAVYRWKWGLGNPVELAGVVPASQLSLVDPGLQPSTLYYYWVVAANSFGGTWSAAAQAVTLGGPPSAPTGLAAAGVNQTSVHVQWNDTSNNELGFIIFRSTGNTWDIIEWLPAGTTSYDDVGRNPNTFYF
ncbi:MAG: IPT/TIG domain-containing protein, partial [Dehalococcoidia bacterium]